VKLIAYTRKEGRGEKTTLLYEYMDGQVYPGIVVSPAPASEVHEPTTPGVEELGKSLLLGTGAAFLTAGLLSLSPLAALSIPVKILLAGGAFAGTSLIAHEALQEEKKKTLRFQVSPAPASQIHEPLYRGVEEI